MSSPSRRAFSLMEVLICVLILSMIIVPILDMSVNSAQVSKRSGRLVEVTMHCQSLLEALSQLGPHELPETPVDTDELLAADEVPRAAAGGPRFDEWLTAFKKKPPLPMKRVVIARRHTTGEVAVRINVTWLAGEGEQRTLRKATFRMLAVPSVLNR